MSTPWDTSVVVTSADRDWIRDEQKACHKICQLCKRRAKSSHVCKSKKLNACNLVWGGDCFVFMHVFLFYFFLISAVGVLVGRSYWSVLNSNRNCQILTVLQSFAFICHWPVVSPVVFFLLCYFSFMFSGLPDNTAFTSCTGDDAHSFVPLCTCSPWFVCSSLSSLLLAFLSPFSLNVFSAMYSQRAIGLFILRDCRIFSWYFFSSGFDRMCSESSLPLHQCRDGLYTTSSEGVQANLVCFLHYRKYLWY